MPSLYMNGRNYTGSGSGGGGGNVYGAFIDTNRVIYDSFVFDETEHTWTATSDCILAGYIDAPSTSHSCYVGINSIDVFIDYESHNGVFIPVKEGQIVTYLAKSGSVMKAYGLTFGTQNIFTPQIYSTEERCVGVWIDNKPLYAKSYRVQSLPNASAVEYSLGISDIDSVAFLGCIAENSSVALPLFYNAGNDNGSKIQIHLSDKATGKVIINTFGDDRSSMSGTVVIQYTKTTDTAGSGSYNTLGEPMEHYSTDEQVVGTDEDGETIYEKTFKVASPTWSSGSGYSTITVDISSIGTVDKLSFVRGTVYDNTDDRMFNIPYFRVADSESLLYECRVNSDGTPYFVLFVRHSSGAGYSLSNLSVTLQYTKSSS